MTTTAHRAEVVFSLACYDAPTAAIKSLALASRSSSYASRHRVFRVMKPIDVRDIDTPGTFVHTILHSSRWRHAEDVRSITIKLGKLPSSRSTSITSEEIAAAVLCSLPHLQHVKLIPDSSYRPSGFEPITRALSRLERLESLDVTEMHSSSMKVTADDWSRIASQLTSIRLTLNQSDRVENRRNPVFRTIVGNAPHLTALDLTGAQTAREVMEILSVLPKPEELKELRLSLKSGQTLSALAIALNRLEGLEEFSISMVGGLESAYFPLGTQTFGRQISAETMRRMGIQSPALRHLRLTCPDELLISLGLGCAEACACEPRETCPSSSTTPSRYMQWLSPEDVAPRQPPVTSLTSPFGWAAVAPTLLPLKPLVF